MVVELIEWDAQPPDVVLPHSLDGLLSQCLGATVEAAGLITEGEIRDHALVETANFLGRAGGNCLELGLCHVFLDHPAVSIIDPCSCEDATRGHMSKGNVERGAGVGQSLGEERIALQGVGLGRLTGIDIRLTRVASRIDDKARPVGLEVFVERLKARVINLRARERHKALATASEFRLKSLADVACGTEEEDHGEEEVKVESGKQKIEMDEEREGRAGKLKVENVRKT